MLFCLLHPMDHNTGPLARKSSTLCSLLLLSIAALLVLAVPGQANSEEVGFGNHTKEKDGDEVTVNIDSVQAPDDLTYAVYEKRFKDVCEFVITKDDIELLYKGKGCTVELLTGENQDITFKTGVKDIGCVRNDCDKASLYSSGFSNLLPFAYSRTKEELKDINEGPTLAEANTCSDSERCEKRKCLSETFLEVLWSKCNNLVYAHTHLIGEVEPGLSQSVTDGKTEFELRISGSEFNMNFEEDAPFNPQKNRCAPKQDHIVKPETWRIKNGELKDKHLLVFHLLPKTATREYTKEGKISKEQPPEEAPKCKLFIRFKRPYYEFLYVGPITTTVTTTTTTTTTPSSGLVGQGPTPKTGTHQGNTPKVQGKGSEKESDNTMMIVIIVIVVVVVVLVIGVVLIFILKNKGSKEDELQKVKQTTTKANKSSAVTL